MLLTRIVDDRVCHLQQGGQNVIVPTCHGREAAQVGSAICIEVGTDFTLPYYRDLGVVLTIGMSPYEVLRTHVQYAQAAGRRANEEERARMNLAPTGTLQPIPYWGYSKHNM